MFFELTKRLINKAKTIEKLDEIANKNEVLFKEGYFTDAEYKELSALIEIRKDELREALRSL